MVQDISIQTSVSVSKLTEPEQRYISGRKKPKKRRRALTGYRLHDRKIDYSGGMGSTRTIKYELIDTPVSEDPQPIRDAVAAAVKSDNMWLYGTMNFNDYLENWDVEKSRPRQEYSFIGFWLYSLSLGFIFSNKAESQFKNYRGIDSIADRIFARMPAKYQECFDKKKWAAWFITKKRCLAGKNEEQRKKILNDLTVEGMSVPTEIMGMWLAEIENKKSRVNDQSWRKKLFSIKELESKHAEQFSDTNLAIKIKEKFGLADYKKSDWAWDPDFPFEDFEGINDRTQLTDKLVVHWEAQENLSADQARIFLSIGNRNEGGNYFNNGILGNFFFICRKVGISTGQSRQDLAELAAQDLCGTYCYGVEEHRRLTSIFLQLGEYAKELPDVPRVGRKWADYRNNFNGTLGSWYSNRTKKQDIAEKQIVTLKELLKDIKTVIDGINDDANKKAETEDSLNFALELTSSNNAGKVNREFSEKLQAALADLRRSLNAYNQQRKAPESRHKKSKNHNTADGIIDIELKKKGWEWQKELKERIQLSPLFFRESAKVGFEKAINLKKEVRKLFRALEETVREKYSVLGGAEIVCEHTADRLAELYNRLIPKSAKGNADVITVLDDLAIKLNVDFTRRTEKARFHLTGYEKRKNIKQLPWINRPQADKELIGKLQIKELIDVDQLISLYHKATETPQNDNLLRDVTQLSKILTAALLYSGEKREQYDNTFLHSELSGYANIISKKEFIARYAVQAINGKQVKIAIVEATSNKGKRVEKYAYTFPHIRGEDHDGSRIALLKIQKEEGSITSKQIVDVKTVRKFKPEVALHVYSSKYQVQFLDWFLSSVDNSKGHRKKKTALTAKGAFTIAEEEIKLDWNGALPAVVQPTGNDRIRLFVSQPFTIVPDERMREGKDAKRFIGVDIGEYGLAYSVLEVTANDGREAAKILDQGFIKDRQQKVLKDYVKEKRKSQVLATFSSPDTKIARIRESLVGSYQNQLQALAIKWNATLSFEFEVSNFESGSSRISKVYDSIKRADVYGMNNAEKADTKQAWGEVPQKDGKAKKSTQMLPWAVEATAAGTSQTCTRCQRWASLANGEKDNDPKPYYGTMRAFRDGKPEYVQVDESITTEDWKKLWPEIRDAMRPPLKPGSAGIRIVEEKISEGSLILGYAEGKRPMSLDELKKQRGNSAIYICPYAECLHIADADLQASFNIALRGYIKNRDKKENERSSWDARYLTGEARKIEVPAVGFLIKEREQEPVLEPA